MTKIQFRWDKFLEIVVSSLLMYLLANANNINFTRAGLIALGTGAIQFIGQALLKKLKENSV